MTARLVGVTTTAAGRTLRQKWWDQVLLAAYRIDNIPEIRSRAWRSELGATGTEREETWNSLTTYEANEHLGSLETQIIEAAEIYEIELIVATSTLYDVVEMPFDFLDQAAENMRLFTELDTSLEDTDTGGAGDSAGTGDSGDPGGSSTSTGPTYGELPTAQAPPPCADEDALEDFQTPPDRCATPSSVVADITHWTTRTTPFFDANACEYRVPVMTPYDCPNGENLVEYVEEFAPAAIAALMEFLQKTATEEDAAIISQYVTSQQSYDFDVITGPHLRLLYQIPFGLIRALRLETAYPATLQEYDTTENTITLDTAALMGDIDTLGEFLGIFGTQQTEFVREQQTQIVVDGSAREINLPAEQGEIDDLKKTIVDILSASGFILPSEGAISRSPVEFAAERKVADKITIVYDSSFAITALFAEEKGEAPTEVSLQTLQRNVGLSSPTMLSYLTSLQPIMDAINTTERISVVDFAQNFHFPPVRLETPSLLGAHGLPSAGPAGATQAIPAVITSTLMDSLSAAVDELTSQFSQYACMSPKEIEDRDAKLRDSGAQLEQILDAAWETTIDTGDKLFDNAASSAQNLVADTMGIATAWESLFNKMSACGLAKTLMQTMDFIADATCGIIDPQEALKAAISSILKNIDLSELQMLFESIPPEVLGVVRAVYTADVSALTDTLGYNGGPQFPWELEQAVGEQREAEERGTLFYAGSLFSTPNRAQILEAQEVSFGAGFEGDFGAMGPDSLPQAEDAFWSGYILNLRADAPPAAEATYEPPINLPEITSPQDVQNLAQQLSTGMVENFVDTLINTLTFDQLIEITQDIPVVGVLLSKSSTAVKCAINVNPVPSDKKSGKKADFNPKQKNLSQGGKFDICGLTGGFKPITMPNMEVAMKQQVNTLWAAFINALIDALTVLLKTLLVKALTSLLKVVSDATEGALCDIVRAVAESIQTESGEEIPTGADLRQLLGNVLGGDGEDQLGRVFSTFGGLALEDTASLLNGENNFIDALAPRLRADELLNLLGGQGSDRTHDTVLDVVQDGYPSLATTLTDRNSVRTFFSSMGTVFPPSFLEEQRQALSALGADHEVIATLCGVDPNTALQNLEDRLREECGEFITEEQIQHQLDSFQQRVNETIDQLAAPLAKGGMDNALEDTFQKVIQETVPKDDPGNLVIAEDIIAGMFNPMYILYTKDLMKPMQPNRNAGFLNMVLANKNGVPQRGQIANYQAAKAFATAMLAGLLPIPLPPADPEDPDAGPAALDILIEPKFFGTHPDLSLKPATIGKYMEDLLGDLPLAASPSTLVLAYTAPADTPLGTDAFVLTYDFTTGDFMLSYAVPFPGREPIQFSAGAGTVYQELLNTGTLVNDINSAITAYTSPSPINLGAGLIAYNSHLFTPILAAPLPGPTDEEFEDAAILVSRMRAATLSRLRDKILSNDRAFDYGEYNLEDLTDNMFRGGTSALLTPAPLGYVLERVVNQTESDTDDSYIVRPPPKGGWLEFKDNLLPETSDNFCCPVKKELFDVESIIDRSLESFKESDDDPRLSLNPRKVEEPPYNKILTRMNGAAIEGTIIATLRSYIIEYFLKGAVSFTKFKTNIPDVYGNVLAGYVARKVRAAIRASGPFPGAPTYPPIIPPMPIPGQPDGNLLFAYWYEFLEQCAQVVSRRVKDGTIQVNAELDQAMRTLQIVVEGFKYPQRSDLFLARLAAGALGADPIAQLSITLKKLRQKAKIDAIRDSEDAAMIIFKHLIIDEYKRVADYVEQIFAEPATGWVDNLYDDFLQNDTYNFGDAGNIFDVPQPGTDLFQGLLRFATTEQAKFEEGQYVLQSYVRVTRTSGGIAEFTDIEDGSVYGLSELALYLAFFGESIRSQDLSAFFESFKYGLRLVYIPSPDDLAALGAAGSTPAAGLRALSPSTGATANRLFGHPPLVSGGSLAEYSFPIVYSEDLELEYSSTLQGFIDEVGPMSPVAAPLALNRTTTATGNFNWPLLSDLLVNSEAYRLMFGYAIPMTDILAILTIYASEGFLASIGSGVALGTGDKWHLLPGAMGATPPQFPERSGIPPFIRLLPEPPPPNNYYFWSRRAFPLLRRKLKKLFRELYNSNDFTYRAEPRDRRAREEVSRTRRETSVGNPFGGLSSELANNVTVQDPGWDCGERESEGTTGDSPSDGSGDGPLDDDTMVCCRIVGESVGSWGAITETHSMTRRECRELGGEEVDPFDVEGCEDLIGEFDPTPPDDDDDDDDIDTDEGPGSEDSGGPL